MAFVLQNYDDKLNWTYFYYFVMLFALFPKNNKMCQKYIKKFGFATFLRDFDKAYLLKLFHFGFENMRKM